jgi:hypothetical protein
MRKFTNGQEALCCDVCSKTYFYADNDDILEIQEFFRFNSVGGYGSIFGDTRAFAIDICQHCFKKNFDKNMRYIDDNDDQEDKLKIDEENMKNCTLTKVSRPDVEGGTRTQVIEGKTNGEPKIGFPFCLIAPPLEKGDVRIVQTSEIEEVNKINDNEFNVKTRSGSIYNITMVDS